ncbi:MAG: hypothetical protein DFNUSKGM_003147, partial [Candidatus Fervidibacter sacchari]
SWIRFVPESVRTVAARDAFVGVVVVVRENGVGGCSQDDSQSKN